MFSFYSFLTIAFFSLSTATVIDLDSQNFEANVLHSSQPWVVVFYNPQRDRCQALQPVLAKLSTDLDGTVNFGRVDRTVHTNISLIERFNVP